MSGLDAVLAVYEEAQAQFPGFTLPNPLRRCTRCEKHAALYKGTEREEEWICGPCGKRVSVFVMPMHPDDVRQRAADAYLEMRGR